CLLLRRERRDESGNGRSALVERAEAAVVTSSYGALEAGAELGGLLGDAGESGLGAAPGGAPSPVDRGLGAASSPSLRRRAGQLPRDGLHLVARCGRALDLAQGLGVLERALQLVQAPSVRAQRAVVDQLAGIASIGEARRA